MAWYNGAIKDFLHDSQDASVFCTEIHGEAMRFGGVVRYRSHLCVSAPPHAIDARLCDVITEIDECCSSGCVRAAIADRRVADSLRADLSRDAVRRYLLPEKSPIEWSREALH